MGKNIYEGVLEIMDGGNGFLRDPAKNFQVQHGDPYVPAKFIRDLALREGQLLTVKLGNAPNSKQSKPVSEILKINGLSLKKYGTVQDYKSAVVIDPEEKLTMRLDEKDRTGRFLDLFTPIGKGQRGMIISPPKAGKTTILKHIANAVLQNHPEMEVIMLLIDERPEEVTDFRRALPDAKVFYSSSDQDVENHIRITTLTMNMATRIAESGGDAIVLIDSLTRMGRAFNKDADSGGKTLSGGLATNALELPRRFFGAARNLEGSGSLTIMATILVETGSRMDEVIFQEFKGTGNLDLMLSRDCADRRLFPAVNVTESGTRKEHKLLSLEEQDEANYIRRKIAGMKPVPALERLLENM